ncbi:hypothetical protein OQA88_2611 [Cercophora sp. LCS_1]
MTSATISSLSRACGRLLDTIFNAAGEARPEFSGRARDEQGRFRVWAANIGAMQSPRSHLSLDHRLGKAPTIHEAVVSELQRLWRSAERAYRILIGELPGHLLDVPPGFSDPLLENTEAVIEPSFEGGFDAGPVSELSELFFAINSTINHLFRLAMVIRGRRPRGRLPGPDRDDQDDQLDASRDIIYLEDSLPKTKTKPWLAERLGKAITQRREYIRYRQSHHVKLARQQVLEEAPPPIPSFDPVPSILSQDPTVGLDTVATTYQAPSAYEMADINAITDTQDDAPRPSISTADQMIPVRTAAPSVVTSYLTVYEGSTHRRIPDLEGMRFDGEPLRYGDHFDCPYCRTIQIMANRLQWRKHVLNDLQPYVSHGNDVTAGQIELLVETGKCSVSRFEASDCPLCDSWTPGTQADNTEGFRQHLGRHLQSLALEAIPSSIEGLELDEEEPGTESSSEDEDLGMGAIIGDEEHGTAVNITKEPETEQDDDFQAPQSAPPPESPGSDEVDGSETPVKKTALRTRSDWARYVVGELETRMRGDKQHGAAFFLPSDLRAVWKHNPLFKDLIHEYLTDTQFDDMRKHMLPFLSFIVWIRDEDWLAGLLDLVTGNPSVSLDQQYLFIPLTVRFDDVNEEIQRVDNPLIRLPFVNRNPETTSGAFGKVEFCTLANECVQIRDDIGFTTPREPVAVAVKTFEVRKEAVKEVRNLRLLKSSLTQNRNLALHRCVLEQGAEFKIMFAQAKLGDLWQFLHCGQPPEDADRDQHRYRFEDRFPIAARGGGGDLIPALVQQSQNLASALKFLHEPRPINGAMSFCAHMDLKPDNILIYDGAHDGKPLPVGHWKICNFGISAFKETKDKIGDVGMGEDLPAAGTVFDLYTIATLRTDAKRHEGTYQPPEVAKLSARSAAGERRKVGRKADIWSFGAIFAEILAFAMGRDAYVRQFRQERLSGCPKSGKKRVNDFFYSKVEVASPNLSAEPPKKEPRLRQSVVDWLERLSANAAAPRRSIQCWKAVILEILQVDPAHRPDAAELERWVGHVYRHVNNAKEHIPPTCPFN